MAESDRIKWSYQVCPLLDHSGSQFAHATHVEHLNMVIDYQSGAGSGRTRGNRELRVIVMLVMHVQL